MITLPFGREEYEARWNAVHREMRARGLETAVVFSRSGGGYDRFQDVFYLSNYYSSQSGYMTDGFLKGYRAAAHAAVILQLGKEPLLVADDAMVEVALVATTRNVGGYDVIAALSSALASEGIHGRVAFVGTEIISTKHFQALQALTPEIAWVPQDDLVSDVRVVKSAAELDAFRHAGVTVSNAMTALFAALQSGASESEAAGEAAREVYRRQGVVHMILLSHGTQTADRLTDNPISCYTTETPAKGDIVRGWVYGAMYQGYWLDPGRTSVIGLRPTPAQKRLIEGCAGIVEKCRDAIRPGVRVTEVATLGERLRQELGGEEDQMSARWPLFGHGNGLFWDPPVIALDYAGKHGVFKEGMVGSTETFVAVPGVGGAGFEQNFIVTKAGTELLTTTPMIWW